MKDWRAVKSIRRAIDTIFKDGGHWLLLIRGDRRFKCPECWVGGTGDSDPNCSACFGIGYSTTLIITPAHISDRGDFSNLEGEAGMAAGKVENYLTTIHLPRESYGAEGDLLLECEWNKPFYDFKTSMMVRPSRILEAYQITNVFRPSSMEVAWLKTSCSQVTDGLDSLREALPTMTDFSKVKINKWQGSYW